MKCLDGKSRHWNGHALFCAQKQKAEDLSILGFSGWTGLEPAPFGVTGRRYNRLNYHPRKLRLIVLLWAEQVSNL